MASHITFQGIRKGFTTAEVYNPVLFDVSADILPGEMTLLTGPSGCGKTTLISILAGILSADEGQINLFGTQLNTLTDAAKTAFRKRHIGFIFQQFNLIPTLSVAENVALPLVIQGLNRKIAVQKAVHMLDQVHLAEKTEALPNQLSVGQQQRVAVARALATEPRLLICDEPTASLDAQNGQLVMGLIHQLAVHPERCVIVVTHDQRVLEYGDRQIAMEDGRVVQVTVHRRERPYE